MQIVIDIPEELYEAYKGRPPMLGDAGMDMIAQSIANGTPLPKGHGRLIDADALKKEYPHDTDWDYPVNTNSCVVESIDNSSTIIEADKEESEK